MCKNGIIYVPPRNIEDSQRLNPAKYIKERVIREQRLMRVGRSSDPEDGGDKPHEEQQLRNRLHSLNKDVQDENLKQLKTKDALFFDSYLSSRLRSTKKSICEGMVFAMERPHYSKAISQKIIAAIKDICLS